MWRVSFDESSSKRVHPALVALSVLLTVLGAYIVALTTGFLGNTLAIPGFLRIYVAFFAFLCMIGGLAGVLISVSRWS